MFRIERQTLDVIKQVKRFIIIKICYLHNQIIAMGMSPVAVILANGGISTTKLVVQ